MTAVPQPAATHGAWVAAFDCSRATFQVREVGEAVAARHGDVEALFSGLLFEPHVLADRLHVNPSHELNAAMLALRAYRELGEGWTEALNGHFAILLFDHATQTTYAVRDRLGYYPLYFARSNGRVIVSWSIDALLQQPDVSGDVNRVVMAEHLAYRWPVPTDTYFAAISRVPPGHALRITRDGTTTVRRYWDLAARPRLDVPEEEALHLFGQRFETAVDRCLARGPSSIFLSGGLDSISVAAMATDMARRTGRPAPHALSVVFPDPACNEEVVQRGAAQRLGIGQDVVAFEDAVGSRGLVASAAILSSTLSAPLLNIWTPAFQRMARIGRERGRRVILTGTGGDEWLSVTPFLAADLWRRGHLAKLARFVGTVQRSYRFSYREALYGVLWRFGARPIAAMLLDRLFPTAFRANRRRKLIASTPHWLAPDPEIRRAMDERVDRVLSSPTPSSSFYEQEMQTALDHPLISAEYEETFEWSRRAGVTVLHPYSDPDLVDLLYRMSPDLLIRGGRAKGLVRDTVAARFPALGFETQRKINATDFHRRNLHEQAPAVWAKLDRGQCLGNFGVVDMTGLAATVDQILGGGHSPDSYRIWSVLTLAAWAQSKSECSTQGRRTQ